MQYILLYFIFFLGHGIYYSTLGPNILDRFPAEAGWIFAAGQIGYPLGFFFSGFVSDRTRKIRNLLIVSLILHAPAQFILYALPGNFWTTLIASGLARFLFAVNFQLISLSVLESSGTVGFGAVRAWGTIGFFFIHLLLFSLERLAPDLSHLADNGKTTGMYGSLFHLLTLIPVLFIQKERQSTEVYRFRDSIHFIRKSKLYIYFIISFIFFFSYQSIDFYLGHFLKSRGGMGAVYFGWTLAVILEIPFLRFSSRILGKDRVRIFFLISMVAGLVRFVWLLAGAIGYGSDLVVFSQILHGLHFTGYYMGTIFVLRKRIPEHLYGTTYGIYVIAAPSLGGAAGSFVYGWLLNHSEWMVSLLSMVGHWSNPGPAFTAPLFLLSAGIHIFLFFTFIFYRSLQDGTTNKESDGGNGFLEDRAGLKVHGKKNLTDS